MANNSVEYFFEILDRFTPALKKMRKSTRNFKAAIKKTDRKLRKFRKSLKKTAQSAKKLGNNLKHKLTTPILALGTAAVITFARLEKGLVNVNNLLSREELKIFGKDLEILQVNALKTGFSIEDVNKGLFDTISALGASESSLNAFAASQILAIGGATNLATAVDGITSIMSVYKNTNVSATEAANAFFSAQVKGKTTVEQLSNAIGQVAPIASAAGVGYKELLAAMSALTTAGLSTDESATSLKGALTALIKPTKEAQKFLKSMGVIFGAANIKSKGLSKTLLSLAVAQKKFGLDAIAKAIPNIRALTGVTALSAEKIKLLDEIVQKINSDLKTGDGLMRAFNDQNKTMAQRFLRSRGKMSAAMKSFAKEFAPQINNFIDKVGKATDKLAALSPHAKRMILVFAGIVAIIPPLLIGLGVLSVAIGAISLPVLAVVGAIGLLIGAVTLLIIKWEKLVNFVKNNPLKAAKLLTLPGLGKELLGKGIDITKKLVGGVINSAGQNNSTVDVGLTVAADKGTSVKKVSTQTSGKNVNLGTNMAGAR